MTEPEIDNLLDSYRNSLGTSSRMPTRSRASRPWKALAVATCTLTVATILLWPHNAAASALRDMKMAISNAKTMEITCSLQRQDSSWWTYRHTFYKDSMWLTHALIGQPMSLTSIIRDGKTFLDFHSMDHASIRPFDPEDYERSLGSKNAIAYILDQVNQGNQTEEREFSIRDHAQVDGRDAYTIHIERPVDGYIANVVVDKASSLPISAESELGLGATKLRYRIECKFNGPLADDLFVQRSDKPIVDQARAQAELEGSWKQPIAQVQSAKVRSACVTSDGTVWIVISGEENMPIPRLLTTDSAKEYAEPLTMPPSAILDVSHRYTQDGEQVIIAGFVPLDSHADLPKSATIQFAKGLVSLPGSPVPPGTPAPTPIAQRVKVSLEREPRQFPAYFPALEMEYISFQLPEMICSQRGKAYESLKQYATAATAYEDAATASYSLSKRGSPAPLHDAARCWRSIGNVERAEADEAKSAKMIGP